MFSSHTHTKVINWVTVVPNPIVVIMLHYNTLYTFSQFSSVQLLSPVWFFTTPWIPARQASLSITNSRSLLKLCPSSRWCHPTISSSVVPFSSCLQSLPASGSFPMSQCFTWGGQSIGVSASASVLPMNTQDWSPLGWTGWISLQSKLTQSYISIITSIKLGCRGLEDWRIWADCSGSIVVWLLSYAQNFCDPMGL